MVKIFGQLGVTVRDPLTTFILGLNTVLSTSFSKTYYLCSSVTILYHISHPHRMTEIIVLGMWAHVTRVWRIWHSEDRASWYIFLIKANEMGNFSNLFDKILYMFRTDPLSIIRSLNTVFTAIGVCHASYVSCLLAWSWPRKQTANRTSMTSTYCCEYSIKTPDDGQWTCPKHVEYFIK